MYKSLSSLIAISITIKVLLTSSCSIGLAIVFIASIANLTHRRIVKAQAKSASSQSIEDVSKNLDSTNLKIEELESKINPFILQSGMKTTRQ